MLWDKIKDSLRRELPEATHALWIEPLVCVRADQKLLELACPDRFFRAWVNENYLPRIRTSLRELGMESVQIRLILNQSGKEQQALPAGRRAEQLRLPAMPEARSFVRHLHPRYTFDEFMVGESNRLAHSACRAIAGGDTSLGPCLYINAGTGLGKSHLTHAVAHCIGNASPSTRLHYLTAQQFTSEMVRRLRSNNMDRFKEKYHNCCDVLLIEDIHTLSGKVKTQAELNEILDILIKSNKRIILTSARPPRDIPNIDEGFRSRMSAGLISTIRPPDIETRRRIIQHKAHNSSLALTEEQAEYLANHIRGDIRQVESAIVCLKAKTSLLNADPDLDMVKEVVTEIMGSSQELTAEFIRNFVAGQFKVSVDDLRSRTRKKEIAFPRQLSMFLARKYTEQGLAEIGRAFNRDHSTVLHSVRVITEAMARNSSVRGQVELLAEKLGK